MTCEYDYLGYCGHSHDEPGTCAGCGRRTDDVDGWCRLCSWLALLDADQAAGGGPVLVKTATP